jgi:hypothetical protein
MTVTMKNTVFWVVTPCDSCKNRCFGGTYHLSIIRVTLMMEELSSSEILDPHLSLFSKCNNFGCKANGQIYYIYFVFN